METPVNPMLTPLVVGSGNRPSLVAERTIYDQSGEPIAVAYDAQTGKVLAAMANESPLLLAEIERAVTALRDARDFAAGFLVATPAPQTAAVRLLQALEILESAVSLSVSRLARGSK